MNTRVRNYISAYLAFVWVLLPVVIYADKGNIKKINNPLSESKVKGWMQSKQVLRFTENKGQMADLQGRAVKDLLFKCSDSGVDFYITTGGLSYVFTNMEKNAIPQLNSSNKLSGPHMYTGDEAIRVQYCRADMELVGADIRKENVIKEYESGDRTDYYLSQCPTGIKDVRSYQKITVKNIYPGIDWVLYRKNRDSGLGIQELGIRNKDWERVGGFKYDFIVHPGADPSVIKLNYKWTDKPRLRRDGSVEIKTPMGDIMEGRPVSYGHDKKHKINTRYSLQGDEIGFLVDKYNSEDTLIIDPSLIWGTYYGGIDAEDVYSMNTDGANVWVTGFSLSPGFPTVSPVGAYFQGTFGGVQNLIILQFSTCGELIWATYYGGSASAQSTSINSDGTNVWVTGMTQATDFPVQFLAGAYNQPSPGGASPFNVFILQFSCVTNSRVWATYYGGTNTDQGFSISSDGIDVWVTGLTNSTDFPLMAVAGGYNQPTLGTYGNAFVLRFSCATSALKWATYYGGSGGDIGYSINSDRTNVWITGSTSSTDLPLRAPPGAYNQPSSGGAFYGDAFISQFSCAGNSLIWATYYGGAKADVGNSISSDGKNVWVTGYTRSTNFPLKTFAGAYNQPALGGPAAYGNAFILQFNCINSALVWATYYGGSGGGYPGDVGYSIQSDGTYVWVCGSATSTNLTTKNSCDFFQGTYGAVFILQFTTSGFLVWATYYGNDTENDGSYISSDGASVFVSGDALAGSTYYTKASVGAFLNSNIGGGAGNENVFMAKFNILCSTPSLTVNPNVAICPGSSAVLTASGSDSYTWSPATGLSSTTGSSVTASPTVTTTYTVTGTLSTSCVSSSATVTVTVNPSPNVSVSNVTPITLSCLAPSVTLMGSSTTAGVTYQWTGGPAGSQNYTVSAANTYTLMVTDAVGNGCTATTTAQVLPGDLPNISIDPPSGPLTCLTTSITLGGHSTTIGATFQWTAGPASASYPVTVAGIYTLVVTDGGGCSNAETVTVISNTTAPANVAASSSGNIDCITRSATLTGSSTTAGVAYQWAGGPATANYSVSVGNTYTVTVTDPVNGCTASTTVSVTANTSIPDISIDPAAPLTCVTTSVTLTGHSTTPGVDYQWITGPGAATNTVSVANIYTLVITDPGNGCTAEQTVTVVSNTTPPIITSAVASNTILTCMTPSSILTGTSAAGTTMVWDGGALIAASYTVTATDASNGCTATSTVTVLSTAPEVSVLSTSPTCIGKTDGSITIVATGTGLTYSWSNASISQDQIGLAGGSYTVTVTDGSGCTATTLASIAVLPDPIADAGSAATITRGASITLSASGGLNYSWTPVGSLNNAGIYNPIANPGQTTDYVVTVTDANGCTAKDSVLITVVDCEASYLFIPTAFSPNGDGQNDVLSVHAPDCITEMKFSVYDRWGELVFETTIPSTGWNGTFRGKVMDTAVFTYYLTASLSNGQSINKKGNVTLLK